MAQVFSDDSIRRIRETTLTEGIDKLRSRIRNVEVEVPSQIEEKKTVDPKYTKEDIANSMVGIYRDKIKPVSDTPYNKQLPTHDPIDRSKEKEEADTIAKRANIRALSNSLANIRNGGLAGPTTEFTPSANGDVNPGRSGNYNALVVAGTEMTLEDYEEHVNNLFEKKKGLWDNIHAKRKRGESPAKPGDKDYPKTLNVEEKSDKDPCWDGYKRKPGTKKFDKGSCVKEDAIKELKSQLMELQDISWQSIDKVMRNLAKEHDITPKELHKDFKAENDGMIPDEWIKENRIKEDCGHIPLDEVVNLNRTGNVFDVTLMWRAHTRRLKFFWPSVKYPSNEDMQDQVDKFYPGGKLIAFYPSANPGDNQVNTIVVVPALTDSYNYWAEDDWNFMSEEASDVYDFICNEEGEPLGPVYVNEDNDYELLVADHSTGEERIITFSEDYTEDEETRFGRRKERLQEWRSPQESCYE